MVEEEEVSVFESMVEALELGVALVEVAVLLEEVRKIYLRPMCQYPYYAFLVQ